MADGKVKTLSNRKITLLGLVAVMAVLLASSFSGTALAYTADDPAVKYHAWVDQDGDGAITSADEVVIDEETGEP